MYEIIPTNSLMIKDVHYYIENAMFIDDTLEKLYGKNTFSEDVDIIDIKFIESIKKADKFDYLYAIFCGVVSNYVNKLVNKMDEDKIELEKSDFSNLENLYSILLKSNKIEQEDLVYAQKRIHEFLINQEDIIKDSINYIKMFEDCAKSFSYKGLFFSILKSVTGIEVGFDEDGKIIINRINKEIKINEILEDVIFGIIEWFMNETAIYRENGLFKDEMNDVFKATEGLEKIKSIIKELSKLKFFNQEEFNQTVLMNWFKEEIKKSKIELNIANEDCVILKKDIPIIFNELMVHSYIFIRFFIQEVKKHNIMTIEQLKLLDLSMYKEENERIYYRIESVSSGVFLGLDLGSAVALEIKMKSKNIAQNLKDQNYVNACLEVIKGVNAVVSSINLNNVCRFITVCKIDSKYIEEDIKKFIYRPDIHFVEKEETLSQENLNYILGLNKNETKILYSLEQQIVKYDIQKTKDAKNMELKQEWLVNWKNISVESLGYQKLFEDEEEKVYKMIYTHANNTKDLAWLYKIILELISFNPYCPLDEDIKKYKKLKLEYKTYIEDMFCKGQLFIDTKEVREIKKSYEKYINKSEGMNTKKVAVVAVGTIAFAAVTGGVALAFAPEIAVALFGGAFPALHGAALVNASLALVGGGSLAAGGFGMAGGTFVIAGGGALIGLGTSGLATSAISLLSSPKYIEVDNAKLLVKCEVILLEKYGKIKEVKTLQKILENDIDSYQLQLKLLKQKGKQSKDKKKIINNLEKSIKNYELTNNNLKKMIKKYKG
ncbi:hypothetical protein [Floccifex sp.]|uniref:hypothetical protein n=1 Tax=Floccifex sp. TaxID=2815810 RepID=UPI003F054199